MKKLLILLLFLSAPAYAQMPWAGWKKNLATSENTTVIGTTVKDTSGWNDTGTRVRTVTTGDSVLIGASHSSAAALGKLSVDVSDAGTGNVPDALALIHETSGTPAANYGVGLRMFLDTNGGDKRDAGRIFTRWTTATDASRASKMVFLTVTGGGSLTRTLQLTNAGARIGSTDSDPSERLHVEGNVLKYDVVDIPALAFNASTGATDTTYNGIPVRKFATSDVAYIDYRLPSYFVQIDSIQILGTTISALGDSGAFSLKARSIGLGESYSAALSSAVIDSSDLGAGNVQIRWKVAAPLAGTASETYVIELTRSACTNNTGSAVLLERVRLHGYGLK